MPFSPSSSQAAVKCLPDFSKGYYRMAQALVEMGKLADARKKLDETLRTSKNGKNADATKMLLELEGKADHPPEHANLAHGQAAAHGRGAGALAARRALIREDRAQRMTVEEVNNQLVARCEHFSVLHRPFDQLRMHHELHAKPDLVLCHNIDYSLLGHGLVKRTHE